jgi:glycosyltransferase involved in cell wall biosynthesis/SAM-dependent methyltransferase
MRIGVLRTQVPFVRGGAELQAANLTEALNRYGHEAVEITLPFKWYPPQVLADHTLAAKMFDLSEVEGVPTDMVIGLKFPAYLVPHPNKLFWVIHQHRQAYDLWDSGHSDLLDTTDGAALRQLVHEEDRAAFASSPHPIYAESRNVADRLTRYLGIEAKPLYHPPPNTERIRQGAYGDYLFAPGRINPSKRLELILQGLAATGSRIRLVVAGVAENPSYQKRLMELARELGISEQITWLGRVDDATLQRSYAEARAVVFVPQDEDYGYITLEAMLAGKPVITVSDAGGPLEFITNNAEGLITRPTAAELGSAFSKVMDDADLAEKMGQAGHARYHDMHISWETVVESLTGHVHKPVVPDSVGLLGEDSVAEEGTRNPQERAVAQLSEAIAPPPVPEDLPFASLEDVLDAYVFEELSSSLGKETPDPRIGLTGHFASYLGTHWTRFLATLSQLDGLTPKHTLDVGVFPPLVFQALLANRFPGIRMEGLWEGPEPFQQHIRARTEHLPSFNVRLEAGNSERDPWPWADGTFDLVTGMEILEHLALDPYFFFSEAARVLKPGGHILLTTPNITSHRGVWKMLNSVAPYSFGTFVPSGGVYGRHNREYAPKELAELGAAAGFETERLTTADVYTRAIDPGIAELLAGRKDDLALRGETIFYLARKTEANPYLPERFYHGDPTRMHAGIKLLEQEKATGLARIALQNRSTSWWPVTGQGATCLMAEWIEEGGDLRHRQLIQPLTTPVPPGETREISLRLDPQDEPAHGTLRLHFYQLGAWIFTGTGRAETLSLPCSEKAFLHLVKTSNLPDVLA